MVVTVGTGKLGSMVGYRITNSNDKEKQGLRAYVAHPSNPQSFLQAEQRVKIANIARVYAALKPVIRRGFESKKYGGMSYLEFLRLNLNAFPDGAWVEKQHITAVPSEFKISQGTLPIVNVAYSAQDDAFKTSLLGDSTITGSTITLQALTNAILSKNSNLNDGDQITVIQVAEYEGRAFEFRTASITLDATNTTKTFAIDSHDNLVLDNEVRLNVKETNVLIPSEDGMEDENVVAAALIVSRDGETEHLRSSATIAVNKTAASMASFYGAEAKMNAIKSFMAAGSEIDWPVEAI